MKNKKEIGRKSHKSTNSNAEVWTEEQYETYLKGIYGMDFIAGYTENGVPYGIFEDEENTEFCSKVATEVSDDEELPF